MPETLLIRLLQPGRAEVEYAVVDPAGRMLTRVQRAELDTLRAQASGRQVVLVTPGTATALFHVRLPTDNRQRMLKAVPYALEEQLAEDIEDLHFAVGRRDGDGRVAVAVTDRKQLEGWLQACEAVGLDPVACYPETLLVPARGEAWTVLADLELGRMMLRGTQAAGYAIEPDAWPMLAPRLPEPQALVFLSIGQQDSAPLQTGLAMPVESGDWAQAGLEHLATGLHQDDLIDLRQGRFSRKEHYNRMWRPWRAAAVLAGLCLVLGFAYQGVRLYQLEARQQVLTGEIEQIYRETFPEAQRVVDARRQMEQQLRRLQGGAGGETAAFLPLLSATGSVFHAMGAVSLQGLNYRDGALDVELTATDLQVLDRLKQSLARQGGYQVEIRSATASGEDKVEGRLRIREVRS